MSQIFHRSANTIARVSIFGALFFIAAFIGLLYQIDRSPWLTQEHVSRDQPQQPGDDEERAENTDSGNGVGAAVKDLRHYNATRAGEWTELNPFATKARLLFCETFHVIVQSGLKLRHSRLGELA